MPKGLRFFIYIKLSVVYHKKALFYQQRKGLQEIVFILV